MVLRETTFVIGGALTIALGILLGGGLYLAGAGIALFDAWLGAGLAVGLGSFFLYVGRAERDDRRRALQEMERSPAAPEPPRKSGR